jgi:hypothetical protein
LGEKNKTLREINFGNKLKYLNNQKNKFYGTFSQSPKSSCIEVVIGHKSIKKSTLNFGINHTQRNSVEVNIQSS